MNSGSCTGSNYLKCLIFNCQSVCNKCTILMEHVIDHDADVLFLSETWLKSKKNNVTATFEEYGYILHHNIRKDRTKELGGGVGILVKKGIEAKPLKVKQYQTFEHCVTKLHVQKGWLTLVSIYRLNYESIAMFFNEFTEMLETLAASKEKFIIAGDINIHCDNVIHPHTIQLNDLLTMFNLIQLIDSPTHMDGHILDILIMRLEDLNILQVEVSDIALSDHFLLSFLVDCKTLKSFYKTITYRNIRQVNQREFTNELVTTISEIMIEDDIGKVVNDFNFKASQLMDKHAPKVTRNVKIVNSAPWFDTEYKILRSQRRKAEKKYKQTRNTADKQIFKDIRKQTTDLARRKKQQYYTSQVNEAKNKPKALFSIVNKLMDVKQSTSLPSANSDTDLANKFRTYFKDKISKIRESFTMDVKSVDPEPIPILNTLDYFEPATEDELRAIVMSYGIRCSPEDPIHVALISQNVDLLLPFWLELVNLSLSTGSMDCLKSAVIIPLLKEVDDFVDPEILKNYRPVSNLLFLSKLIERCVASRLDKHMADNSLESTYQYGYKKGHSTELLLVNVVNSLLNAFDNKYATVLLLLDLSAAFDTVDQDKLLQILYNYIGITGTAFKWFISFLKGRTQKVMINNSFSTTESLNYGVAQGSVLGPRLFNIYTKPLYPHIHASAFEVEGYADDHQLFKKFIPVFQTMVLGSAVNECLRNVSEWMNSFFLQLNKSKTKILVLAPPSIMPSIHIHGTFLDDGCIRFVNCAKNLGVWIDNMLNFKTHVKTVVSSCYKIICELSKIRSFLPQECLNTLATSLVLSKLDYCNSLYYKIGANEINMLQAVQNSAIRLVYGKFKYDRAPISHLFIELHWLKIRERIIFKICLIVHKCIWGLAPESLKSLIVISNVRTYKLVEKKFSSVFGERAFSRAGPKLWNTLPLSLRMENNTDNFKKLLKSRLITDTNNFHSLLTMC